MVLSPIQRIKSLLKSGEEFLTISAYLYQYPAAQKCRTEFLDFFELARSIKFNLIKLSDSVDDDKIALSVKAYCNRIDRLMKLPLYNPEHFYVTQMK